VYNNVAAEKAFALVLEKKQARKAGRLEGAKMVSLPPM
jgi:hypothetical protein